MPFQSKAQIRYLYAKKPEVAKEFASKTKSTKSLPQHKSYSEAAINIASALSKKR